MVQEAYLRAYGYFDSYQGGDMRPWLLAIVRNCYSTLGRQRRSGRTSYVAELPTEDGGQSLEPLWSIPARDPEALLLHGADSERVNALMQELPPDYREVLLLREVEELSYRRDRRGCRRAGRDGDVMSGTRSDDLAAAVVCRGR